jgi:CBS domain-containing protein
MFPGPGAEFRIAIAGPLVTLVIGAVFLGAGEALSLPSAVDGVVVWVGYTNLFLLGFNLLPAFPLDGGRVLHSALWKLRGDLDWATSVAGTFGRAIGALMIGAGVLTFLATFSFGGLWLAFIGWFLIAAAAGETRLTAIRRTLAGRHVGDAMARDPVTAPPDLTLQEFLDRVYSGHPHTIYPVTDDGKVLGLIEARDAGDVPEAQRRSVHVNDRMQQPEQVVFVREQDDLAGALTTLLQTDLRRALVLRDSQLVGVLSLSDVERLAESSRRSERG